MNNDNLLIAIVGPTGVGKTACAIELAKKYGAELISVDSRQIYIGMDIATGKEVDKGIWTVCNDRKTLEIDAVRIHGLDLVRPNQDFSVSDWYVLANQLIQEIRSRGNQVLLVGGTGFYLSALQGKIATMLIPADPQLRQELDSLTLSELNQMLHTLAPDKAGKIDSQNKRRLIRAIELSTEMHKPQASRASTGYQSAAQMLASAGEFYNVRMFGLTMNRHALYQKVDQRIDQMVEQGLMQEAEQLILKYGSELPSMTGIGYAEAAAYLAGHMKLNEAVQKMKWRTHAYIRRQYTWFRKQPVEWVEVGTGDWRDQIDELVGQSLRQ